MLNGNRRTYGFGHCRTDSCITQQSVFHERFDSYRFADHKQRVAGLLARVTRVSVETVAIVAAMRAASSPAGRAA